MSEEKKDEGTQETQETQQTPETLETLEAIKAELEEEKKALAEKDALIADLQAQLSEAKKGSEAAAAELASVKKAHSKAVSKYLDAMKLANIHLPPEVIAGSTIEEIDASVAKALPIAESVKKALEAQAKEAKVPAGAPTRGEISLEGLSPREKIAAGIQQGSQR